MSTVTITVNGKQVEAKEGEYLLAVTKRAGAFVPTLCHYDGISPYGSCRLCTVKVSKGDWNKFVTACNYPVWDGMEVDTEGPEVQKIRKLVIEALWSRAPKAEVLERLAKMHKVTERRFPNVNPEERCILCGLCVRVCDEVVGARALGFVGRGQDRAVGTPFMEHPDSCIGCGACAHVCPTDAIDMEERTTKVLRERWGEQRPCRYALMGLLPGSVCHNNYECWRCETDQTIMDLFHPLHPVFVAKGVDSPGVRSAIRKLAAMLPPEDEECEEKA